MVEAEGIAPSSASNLISVSTSVSPDLFSQVTAPRSGLRHPPVRNCIPRQIPDILVASISSNDGNSEVEEKSLWHRSSLTRLLERNSYWLLLFCRFGGHGTHARCSNPTTHVEPGRPHARASHVRAPIMVACFAGDHKSDLANWANDASTDKKTRIRDPSRRRG